MGPLAGVMVCDYYLIKKRKLDLHQLYANHGIYWYTGGWNWRAYASFVIGFAPLLPGFAKSIDHSLDVGGAWKIYTFAWLYGFFTSTLVHYLICTYVSVPHASFVEHAVYPAQIGEEPPAILEGEESGLKETHVSTREKDSSDMA
jgi:cytosine/uracil/thiamine/allantoin permease